MMKQFLSFVLAILFSGTLWGCISEDVSDFQLQVGDAIPNFTVEMSDGTTVSDASLREGVAVIVFFHIGCPDCQLVLPSVQQLYDTYQPVGVRFAVISREQGQEPIATYWREHGFDMPYSAQPDRSVYHLFAGSRVPRVYFCKQGIIQSFYTDSPVPTYEDLDASLRDLLP